MGNRYPFCPGIKGHLKGLSQVLDRHNTAAQAHAPQHHQLGLNRFPQYGGTEGHKRGEGHGLCGTGVMKFYDVDVVVKVLFCPE